MNFTQVLDEIPRLSAIELQQISRLVDELQESKPKPEWRAEVINGRTLLVAPRIIRQSEVEAILDEFP